MIRILFLVLGGGGWERCGRDEFKQRRPTRCNDRFVVYFPMLLNIKSPVSYCAPFFNIKIYLFFNKIYSKDIDERFYGKSTLCVCAFRYKNKKITQIFKVCVRFVCVCVCLWKNCNLYSENSFFSAASFKFIAVTTLVNVFRVVFQSNVTRISSPPLESDFLRLFTWKKSQFHIFFYFYIEKKGDLIFFYFDCYYVAKVRNEYQWAQHWSVADTQKETTNHFSSHTQSLNYLHFQQTHTHKK